MLRGFVIVSIQPPPSCRTVPVSDRQNVAWNRVSDLWISLLSQLTVSSADDRPELSAGVASCLAAGGEFFEVVAGTPQLRYGPRLTFTAPRTLPRFLHADHPWGRPHWLGIRIAPDRRWVTKPYHLRFSMDGFPLPSGLPTDVRPVMASRDGNTTEIYLRAMSPQRWSVFAAQSAALIDAPPPQCAPQPRPSTGSFALSLRWEGSDLTAVTVFADQRALPFDDDAIANQWIQGMDDKERTAYLAAYVGTHAFGSSPTRSRHAMLGWTLEAGGGSHRAASLRLLHRRIAPEAPHARAG
jgi:hypothetical protein